jgi:hypothetical protein
MGTITRFFRDTKQRDGVFNKSKMSPIWFLQRLLDLILLHVMTNYVKNVAH